MASRWQVILFIYRVFENPSHSLLTFPPVTTVQETKKKKDRIRRQGCICSGPTLSRKCRMGQEEGARDTLKRRSSCLSSGVKDKISKHKRMFIRVSLGSDQIVL